MSMNLSKSESKLSRKHGTSGPSRHVRVCFSCHSDTIRKDRSDICTIGHVRIQVCIVLIYNKFVKYNIALKEIGVIIFKEVVHTDTESLFIRFQGAYGCGV